jgi:hypothetical protein
MVFLALMSDISKRCTAAAWRAARRRRIIVVCSATASRRRLSDGSAASAASMVASEMSVTGKSRLLRRDFDHAVLLALMIHAGGGLARNGG